MVLITVEELSIKALGYISVSSRSETRLLGQQPDLHSSHDTQTEMDNFHFLACNVNHRWCWHGVDK